MFFSDTCRLLANFFSHALLCTMERLKCGLDQNCDIWLCDVLMTVFISTKHVLEDRSILQPCSFHKGML